MGTYAFANVNATLSGPGGVIPMGYGAGTDKGGISVEMIEDKDLMTIGSDGSVMHSLRSGNGARVTVRLLKTSPINALLSAMYNFQDLLSGSWGQNTIRITDIVRGDIETVVQAAFAKYPGITYAEDGGMNEWTFFGVRRSLLGVGSPDVNTL